MIRPLIEVPLAEKQATRQRAIVCSTGLCLHEPRCCSEISLFGEKVMEAIEANLGRSSFEQEFWFVNYEAFPNVQRGSFGIDREWTATLVLGSLRRAAGSGVVGRYEIEVG